MDASFSAASSLFHTPDNVLTCEVAVRALFPRAGISAPAAGRRFISADIDVAHSSDVGPEVVTHPLGTTKAFLP